MIPVYRTIHPEETINLLALHYRRVLCNCKFSIAKERRRLLADKLRPSPYFDKTESQINLWQNNGGILIAWDMNWERRYGPHEVMYFAECPSNVDRLDVQTQNTSTLAVIYTPPDWGPHRRIIKERYTEKADWKKLRAQDRLERMIQLVEAAPKFTPRVIEELRQSQQDQPQRSTVRESPAI